MRTPTGRPCGLCLAPWLSACRPMSVGSCFPIFQKMSAPWPSLHAAAAMPVRECAVAVVEQEVVGFGDDALDGLIDHRLGRAVPANPALQGLAFDVAELDARRRSSS